VAAVLLEAVDKIYPTGHAGVRDITLHVGDGELVVLVGPSGSGKSTTLRLVAGLESPTSGRIAIGRRDVTLLPPQERDLAMVFQSYALYPHKTVRGNLAFPLETRGLPRDAVEARVNEIAGALQIADLLDRRPAQLSGGQRQRVALGRALVREPQAFLFDEPLSNLDVALRLEMRTEIARLHHRLGATMLYVTHDQEEAMTLGDRLVVMRDSRIEQVGPPMLLYEQPETLFVARFLGSPPMNVLARPPAAVRGPVGTVTGIRPQDVVLVDPSDPSADATAQVEVVEPLGREQHVHLAVGADGEADRAIAAIDPGVPVSVGDRVGLRLRRDRLYVFDQQTGMRVRTS
jgi:ABC-type sugar transport system ATPase subunit